jgi:hypothetical protein
LTRYQNVAYTHIAQSRAYKNRTQNAMDNLSSYTDILGFICAQIGVATVAFLGGCYWSNIHARNMERIERALSDIEQAGARRILQLDRSQ